MRSIGLSSLFKQVDRQVNEHVNREINEQADTRQGSQQVVAVDQPEKQTTGADMKFLVADT